MTVVNPVDVLLRPLRWAARKLTGGHASGGAVPQARAGRGQVVIVHPGEGFCGRCGWDAPPGSDADRLLAFLRHVEETHRPRV